MTLEEFRSKICDSMGTPQRKQMCFQATPTAETLENFLKLDHYGLNFVMKHQLELKL